MIQVGIGLRTNDVARIHRSEVFFNASSSRRLEHPKADWPYQVICVPSGRKYTGRVFAWVNVSTSFS